MSKRYWVRKLDLHAITEPDVLNMQQHIEVCIYNDIKDNLIEWHSVENKLPKIQDDYWIYFQGCYSVVFWDGDNFRSEDGTRIYPTDWAVPKPPKGVKND